MTTGPWFMVQHEQAIEPARRVWTVPVLRTQSAANTANESGTPSDCQQSGSSVVVCSFPT